MEYVEHADPRPEPISIARCRVLHPDFPLRGFVRCQTCGLGLIGSWSKGRRE